MLFFPYVSSLLGVLISLLKKGYTVNNEEKTSYINCNDPNNWDLYLPP